MQEYHDREWGVPLYDDLKLFEFLILEGMQAGLTWLTILQRRSNYLKAFDNLDPVKIARYTPAKIEKLLKDPGIIRNRLKVNAVVTNARAFLEIRKKDGDFSRYIWSFVDGKPMVTSRKTMAELPAETDISRAMSKNLKKRGFKFVGPTICYAFMQATGMVNDHTIDCFRYRQVGKKR